MEQRPKSFSAFTRAPYFLYILWVSIMAIIAILIIPQSVIIFDGNKPNFTPIFTPHTLTDAKEHGDSECILTLKDNVLEFTYVLGNKHPTPFVNLMYTLDTLIDIRSLENLKIELKASQGIRVPIYLCYKQASTNSKYKLRDRYTVSHLECKKELKEYTIPIREMETPDWWYISNAVTEDKVENIDYANLSGLYLANCINLPRGSEDTIHIRYIALEPNYTKYFIKFGLMAIVGLALIYFLLAPKNKSIQINLPVRKAIQLDNKDHQELKLVQTYIEQHYTNPSLTLTDIQKDTGIHEKKISHLLKLESGLLFKAYLNQHRLAKAKALLTSTSMDVNEIAYAVGYNNVSHFNRVFKEANDTSPSSYRETKASKNE